jgi:hypothetical protein
MILIVCTPHDGAADFIERRLRERGEDVLAFNPARFPTEYALSLAYSARGDLEARLIGAERTIDLRRLTAVWWHQRGQSVAHDEIVDPKMRSYVEHECRVVLGDVWQLTDCLWLPGPPSVIGPAQYKLTQLKLAAEVGFELPPTLVTTNPNDLAPFYRAHDGQVISKTAGVTSAMSLESDSARYTEPVAPRDLGYADALRFCPIVFQAYVPKRVELRVTVVGDRIFAAEIHTQGGHRTRFDWRHYDGYRTPYAPHDLPSDVERSCLRLVERLGLRYGAIDLILTPDGRYVFLEINPGGQFAWIELATGMPITDAICDLMVAEANPTLDGRQSAVAAEGGFV